MTCHCFIGQYTAPLECMRPGYRHLSLRSIFDEPLDDATLFVHISYTDVDCPLLGRHLSSMLTTSGSSSPTNHHQQASSAVAAAAAAALARPPSIKRNGSSSSIPRWTSRKKSRSSQSGSLTREPEPINLCPIGLPGFDNVFGSLAGALGKVAAIRDSMRISLAVFRESCGLPAPTSIKRCVRTMQERSRCTSGGGGGSGKLEQPDERDLVIGWDLKRHPKLYLSVKGGCAVGDGWKKIQSAFDNLVSELTLADEMSEPLIPLFESSLEEISRLYEVGCCRGCCL